MKELEVVDIILSRSYKELLESSDEEEDEEGGAESSLGSKNSAKQQLHRKMQRGLQQGGCPEIHEGKAWIREGPEDEPLNFLDPSVVQRVVGKWRVIGKLLITSISVIKFSFLPSSSFAAVDPVKMKKSSRKGGFATDGHGRLVITEEAQTEKSSQVKDMDEEVIMTRYAPTVTD